MVDRPGRMSHSSESSQNYSGTSNFNSRTVPEVRASLAPSMVERPIPQRFGKSVSRALDSLVSCTNLFKLYHLSLVHASVGEPSYQPHLAGQL